MCGKNPSLISQLKSIELGNLMTKMERDETGKKDCKDQEKVLISEAKGNELFGESNDEEEFVGFDADSEEVHVSGANVVVTESEDV